MNPEYGIDDIFKAFKGTKKRRTPPEHFRACLPHISLHPRREMQKGEYRQAVSSFIADVQFIEEKYEQVEKISYDKSPDFINSISNHLPQAGIFFVRFCFTKVVNNSIDAIQREEFRSNPIIKGSKKLFLNKVELNQKQRMRIEALRISAMILKEFRDCHIRGWITDGLCKNIEKG